MEHKNTALKEIHHPLHPHAILCILLYKDEHKLRILEEKKTSAYNCTGYPKEMFKKLYNYTVNDTQLHNKCKKNANTNILCVVFKVVLYTWII